LRSASAFDAFEVIDGVPKKVVGAPVASNRERPGIIRDFSLAGKALRGLVMETDPLPAVFPN
jgi:hypothetical protein